MELQLIQNKISEWQQLVTICDQLPETLKHSSVSPTAFTEQGTSMLSAVLRSETAVRVSIVIMRAFVAMRRYITSTATLTAELAEIRAKLKLPERNSDDNIKAVNDLSEDVRKDMDIIYAALERMAAQPAESENPRRPNRI